MFMVGLTLSAGPHCGIAFVGCMLSCAVVLEAMASLIIYKFEREWIINDACENPIRVDSAEDNEVKPSVRVYATSRHDNTDEPCVKTLDFDCRSSQISRKIFFEGRRTCFPFMIYAMGLPRNTVLRVV